jgi:hypothetical protein
MFKLPNKPYHIVQQFLIDNRPLVFRYLVKKIKFAIDSGISSVDLFELPSINSSRRIAIVKEIDYEKVLEQAIEACSQVEDYETAAKAQTILQSYRHKHIEQLISEINKQE